MQIEKIKLPSEETDNPVDGIFFYKKPKNDGLPVELLKGEEIEKMVILLIITINHCKVTAVL